MVLAISIIVNVIIVSITLIITTMMITASIYYLRVNLFPGLESSWPRRPRYMGGRKQAIYARSALEDEGNLVG